MSCVVFVIVIVVDLGTCHDTSTYHGVMQMFLDLSNLWNAGEKKHNYGNAEDNLAILLALFQAVAMQT